MGSLRVAQNLGPTMSSHCWPWRSRVILSHPTTHTEPRARVAPIIHRGAPRTGVRTRSWHWSFWSGSSLIFRLVVGLFSVCRWKGCGRVVGDGRRSSWELVWGFCLRQQNHTKPQLTQLSGGAAKSQLDSLPFCMNIFERKPRKLPANLLLSTCSKHHN